jgi:hypothetical protein
MNCREYRDAIAELADGPLLDQTAQRALERHVEACPDCGALLADLKSIQAAAFTLDRMEVPPHIWDGVRARVAADGPAYLRRQRLAWPVTPVGWSIWAGAAATLLLATTLGIYTLIGSGGVDERPHAAAAVSEPPDLVASIQADLQAAEEHYEKAIQGLEQIARSESGALDPQMAAVLQKNLQVIDHAIGESRAALQAQPASALAQDSLFEAMRSKVAVLQQTVELINEMRKGNQAEAGRLIQGLNQ